MTDFVNNLKYVQSNISNVLNDYYISKQANNSLLQAIEYSLFNSGKKYRPFLVWASGTPIGASENSCFKVGAVLEMLHTYSLIHDDLPSMDNDDTRHGKPSSHKKYGEAKAILTGDALLTDAFYFLSSNKIEEEAEVKLKIINYVASYLGSNGMILGQVLDIEGAENTIKNLDEINQVHLLKTAKFMELCVVAGGVLAKATEQELIKIAEFGKKVGLAFQIMDDISDFESDKTNNICNFLSPNDAKKQAKELVEDAINHLNSLNYNFNVLKQFAATIIS